jgi:hypothetical protein
MVFVPFLSEVDLTRCAAVDIFLNFPPPVFDEGLRHV